MQVSQYGLGLLAGISFLCGIAAGGVYDVLDAVFRDQRTVIRHIAEFLFVNACGIAVIIILFDMNDGVFRTSSPILFAIGFAAYRCVKLRPVFRVACFVILISKRLFKAIYSPIASAVSKQIKKAALKRELTRQKKWAITVYRPEALYERTYRTNRKTRHNRTAGRQKKKRQNASVPADSRGRRDVGLDRRRKRDEV